MTATQVELLLSKFSCAHLSIQASKLVVLYEVISIAGPGISSAHTLRKRSRPVEAVYIVLFTPGQPATTAWALGVLLGWLVTVTVAGPTGDDVVPETVPLAKGDEEEDDDAAAADDDEEVVAPGVMLEDVAELADEL